MAQEPIRIYGRGHLQSSLRAAGVTGFGSSAKYLR
jgi:hypothetical protein